MVWYLMRSWNYIFEAAPEPMSMGWLIAWIVTITLLSAAIIILATLFFVHVNHTNKKSAEQEKNSAIIHELIISVNTLVEEVVALEKNQNDDTSKKS